jgi:regulatory factor X
LYVLLAFDINLSTILFFFIDCGIRPATSAEAEWLQDYIHKSNNNAGQQSVNAARAQDQSENPSRGDDGSGDDEDEDSEEPSSTSASKRNSLALTDVKGSPPEFRDLSDKTPTAATLLSQAQAAARPSVNTFSTHAPIRRHTGQEGGITVQSPSPQSANTGAPAQFMSPQQPVSVRHLPHFPSIEEAIGSNSTSTQSVAAREVWGWFQDHLDALLESVRSFRFDQFEMHLRTFWTSLAGNHREVVHAPAIAGLMAKADAIVYDVSSLARAGIFCLIFHQEILEILRSQMLSPIPPASVTSLRQLAVKMEKILLVALENYGNTFVEPKVELGARFGHLVSKYCKALNARLVSYMWRL